MVIIIVILLLLLLLPLLLKPEAGPLQSFVLLALRCLNGRVARAETGHAQREARRPVLGIHWAFFAPGERQRK